MRALVPALTGKPAFAIIILECHQRLSDWPARHVWTIAMETRVRITCCERYPGSRRADMIFMLRRTSHGFVMRGSQRLRMLADSFQHLHRYTVFHQHAFERLTTTRSAPSA